MSKEEYKKLFSFYFTRIEQLDVLFKPIDKVPNDHDSEESIAHWLKKNKAHRASIRHSENTNYLLKSLLKDYQKMNTEQRTLIRELFEKHPTFSSSIYIDRSLRTNKEYFFDSLLLISIKDYEDTRDIIMRISSLSKQANEEKVLLHPMMKIITNLSSDIDRYSMGSMKDLLK